LIIERRKIQTSVLLTFLHYPGRNECKKNKEDSLKYLELISPVPCIKYSSDYRFVWYKENQINGKEIFYLEHEGLCQKSIAIYKGYYPETAIP